MRKYILNFVLIALTLLISACKTTDSNPVNSGTTSGTVTLNGKVVDFSTGTGIGNAAINVFSANSDTTLTVSSFTKSDGSFSISFTISRGFDIKIAAIKEGYTSDTTVAFATPGRTVDVNTFSLKVKASGGGGQGTVVRKPASIYLLGSSKPSIGVRGSGALETTVLTFEVQDSMGVALDLVSSVAVNFKLGASPGGGASITPAAPKTDGAGKINLIVTSGTIAGVLQIVAEITQPTLTIYSYPVSVAIHGGLPDLAHFAVAPALLNIPGYNIFGVTDNITAFVGDKYGNPVKIGSSVYFTTSGGIIVGSAQTGETGQAAVSLISALPRPEHLTYGKGYATITATTADETRAIISANCIVLFSGVPTVSVSPISFDIANGSSQQFIYRIMDQNGNPLAGGTKVQVKGEGENFYLRGETDVDIPDTQSKSWTQFSFVVGDPVDTVNVPKPLTIQITSTGANGKVGLVFSGIVR